MLLGYAEIMVNFAVDMETKANILIVDDEETLREALRFHLESEGYAVSTASCSEDALAMDLSGYDLFLLDIMMGEISGLQLAKILKNNPSTASKPIIFCTAKDTDDDLVTGLDLGADDYIPKPFTLKAVSARIRALLRRIAVDSSAKAVPEAVEFEGIRILPDHKQCFVDGIEVRFPKKEFEILLKFLTHRGRIFSREELLRSIWTDEVVVLDRVVDVNITRIRQKLGRYGKNVVTRSGYGYGFVE